MATKRLARSIIELGRGSYNKYGRRLRASSNRHWRLEDGEYEPGPVRGDRRELRDNLNPLRRWLLSKAGRSWAKVFSEFCSKVSRGSVQGDHIHGHLKEMVKGAGSREYDMFYDHRYNEPCRRDHGYYGFWIDTRGILRHHTRAQCAEAAKKIGWKRQPYPESRTVSVPILAVAIPKPARDPDEVLRERKQMARNQLREAA